jgi:hypothetical protein
VNDITDENGRVSQDYLIEKLKNKVNFFSEFSRLKKAMPKEWYVQLSEGKSVKTTINIKKENDHNLLLLYKHYINCQLIFSI